MHGFIVKRFFNLIFPGTAPPRLLIILIESSCPRTTRPSTCHGEAVGHPGPIRRSGGKDEWSVKGWLWSQTWRDHEDSCQSDAVKQRSILQWSGWEAIGSVLASASVTKAKRLLTRKEQVRV